MNSSLCPGSQDAGNLSAVCFSTLCASAGCTLCTLCASAGCILSRQMRGAALRGKALATMEQLWGNLGGTMGQLTPTTPPYARTGHHALACSPSSASSTKLRDWGKGGNNYGKFSRLDVTSHQHTLLQGQILPSHVLLHLQVHCREERLKRELGGRIMRKSSRHFARPSWHSLPPPLMPNLAHFQHQLLDVQEL